MKPSSSEREPVDFEKLLGAAEEAINRMQSILGETSDVNEQGLKLGYLPNNIQTQLRDIEQQDIQQQHRQRIQDLRQRFDGLVSEFGLNKTFYQLD